MDQYEVKKILAGEKVENAYKMKILVLYFQKFPVGTCPYVILCGRPQSNKEANNFNDTMFKALSEFCKKTIEAIFLNSSVDNESVDANFFCIELCQFLEGKANHCLITDPNHNTKSFYYQLIKGSCIPLEGIHDINAQMLQVEGISKYLWRLKEFASDIQILKLAS